MPWDWLPAASSPGDTNTAWPSLMAGLPKRRWYQQTFGPVFRAHGGGTLKIVVVGQSIPILIREESP